LLTVYRYQDKTGRPAGVLIADTSELKNIAIDILHERLPHISAVPPNALGFLAWIRDVQNEKVFVGGGRLFVGYRDGINKGLLPWEEDIKKQLPKDEEFAQLRNCFREDKTKEKKIYFRFWFKWPCRRKEI